MKLAMGKRMGISKQREYWLCWLLGAAFLFSAGSLTWAKVAPEGPLHLWRLHGFYMDPDGKPLENVELTLERDGAVLDRTKTDSAGKFAFEHLYGRYTLRIDKSSKYSQLSREVIVGLEAATILRKNTLYIVAGPGACTDDCSSVFTNKYDYDKAIRRNTEHHY